MQSFKKLAEGLPYAKHVHSRLVCAITKEIMNEHDPPVVLPNGIVYSKKAIQQNSNQGDGVFVDPISGRLHHKGLHRRQSLCASD